MADCAKCGNELELYMPSKEWGKDILYIFLLCSACGKMLLFRQEGR